VKTVRNRVSGWHGATDLFERGTSDRIRYKRVNERTG